MKEFQKMKQIPKQEQEADPNQIQEEKMTQIKPEKGPEQFIKKVMNELLQIRSDYYSYYLISKMSSYKNYKRELSLYDDADFGLPKDEISADYARYGKDHMKQLYENALKKVNDNKMQNQPNVSLLLNSNSQNTKEKLKVFANYDVKGIERRNSIYAENTQEENVMLFENLSVYPSTYQLLKFLYPANSNPDNVQPEKLTDKANDILISESFNRIIRKSYAKGSNLLYKIIVKSINGLKDLKFDEKHDVFAMKLLEYIQKTLNFIDTYAKSAEYYNRENFEKKILDKKEEYSKKGGKNYNLKKSFERLSLFYEFLNDLLFVLYAYESPYKLDDYKDAVDKIQKSRIPTIEENKLTMKHYPVRSGMDAVITAFLASQDSPNKNKTSNIMKMGDCVKHVETGACYPLYFELPSLFNDANNSIVITGLTSEMISNDLNTIITNIDKLLAKNSYVTLIIDTTIELRTDNDPTTNLINSLKDKITDGKLNVILAKSYQKFATLGTTKIVAGNITVINNGDTKFDYVNKYLKDTADNNFEDCKDEYQMLIHQLKYNGDSEIKFVERATETAKKLTNYLNQKGKVGEAISNGPFVFIDNKYKGYLSKEIPGVETFGFTFTTSSSFSLCVRMSIGLEPFEVLKNKIDDSIDYKEAQIKDEKQVKHFDKDILKDVTLGKFYDYFLSKLPESLLNHNSIDQESAKEIINKFKKDFTDEKLFSASFGQFNLDLIKLFYLYKNLNNDNDKKSLLEFYIKEYLMKEYNYEEKKDVPKGTEEDEQKYYQAIKNKFDQMSLSYETVKSLKDKDCDDFFKKFLRTESSSSYDCDYSDYESDNLSVEKKG